MTAGGVQGWGKAGSYDESEEDDVADQHDECKDDDRHGRPPSLLLSPLPSDKPSNPPALVSRIKVSR